MRINEFNLLKKSLKTAAPTTSASSSTNSAAVRSGLNSSKRLPPLLLMNRQKTDLMSASTIRSNLAALSASVTAAGSLNGGDNNNASLPSSALSSYQLNNNFKCAITVDTTKARSNSEVLRLCINELGWTECAFQVHYIQYLYTLYRFF